MNIFSDSTRDILDKLLIGSTIGFTICTFANPPKTEAIGPFELDLSIVWALPGALAAVLLYYSVCLLFLAKIDFTRWTANYSIANARIVDVITSANRMANEKFEEMKQYAKSLENNIEEYKKNYEDINNKMQSDSEFIRSMNDAVSSGAEPGDKMQKQAGRQVALFVVFPVIFSAISTILLVRSAIVLYWQ